MAVNKVDYSGGTLIDLTNDTVTDDTLSEGVTAHGADGEPITGTLTAVQYGKVQSLTDEQKAQARENIGAASDEKPEVVGSIEECVDTSKKYVLPDGYIYEYRKKFIPGSTTPNFTNQVPISLSPEMDGSVYNGVGYKHQVRLTESNGGSFAELEHKNPPTYTTGLIPVKNGDVIRVNSIIADNRQGFSDGVFRLYTEGVDGHESIYTQNNKIEVIRNGGGEYTISHCVVEGYPDVLDVVSNVELPINKTTFGWVSEWLGSMGWFVCQFSDTTNPEDVVITVNEEITYTVVEDKYEWNWENTGELYVTPDYLGMIADLEERIGGLEKAGYAPVIKVTSAGDEITDAAGGQAASVVVSLSPKLEDGSLAPNPTGGRFAPWEDVALSVNGVGTTAPVAGSPYAGTLDVVSGKTESAGVRLYQATDLFKLDETTAPGTSSAGVKYIRATLKDDVASLDFINLLVACNRYEARTASPYNDKTIRINSNRPYIYDNDIDFDNPLAILDGVEFLLSDGTAETFSGLGWPVVLEQGNNTITSDSGDVTVTYGIDTKTYIDRKFAELSAALLGG